MKLDVVCSVLLSFVILSKGATESSRRSVEKKRSFTTKDVSIRHPKSRGLSTKRGLFEPLPAPKKSKEEKRPGSSKSLKKSKEEKRPGSSKSPGIDHASSDAITSSSKNCSCEDARHDKQTRRLEELLDDGSHYVPSCCIGGVTALRMVYKGTTSGTLLASKAAAGTWAVDPCYPENFFVVEEDNATEYVVFADCDLCFPTLGDVELASCVPSVDTYLHLDVKPGQDVCLLSTDVLTGLPSLNAKFPTKLPLYFRDASSNFLYELMLHTTCSEPIYQPFGVHLESCPGDSRLVNLDLDIPTCTHLEFVDGISSKDRESLFASCSLDFVYDLPEFDLKEDISGRDDYDKSIQEDFANKCCSGGVSALSMIYRGNASGILHTSATLVNEKVADPCRPEQTFLLNETGYKVDFVFVDCDVCFPKIGDANLSECDPTAVNHLNLYVRVGPGQRVCLISLDSQSQTSKPVLDQKLPPKMFLYFRKDDDSSPFAQVEIDTSCSKPVYPPFGVRIASCGDSQLINLKEKNMLDSSYFEFVDGVGVDSPNTMFTGCQGAGNEVGGHTNEEPVEAPGLDYDLLPLPPTSKQSPSSTEPQKSKPSTSPSQKAPWKKENDKTDWTCEDMCTVWVFHHCVASSDEGRYPACAVPHGKGRSLFEVKSSESEITSHSIHEQIRFHRLMVALYEEVLIMIE